MSVNSENHVLGLWIGGGVTPAALRIIEIALREAVKVVEGEARPSVVAEIADMANACHAQLSKLPKPDPARYL